MPRPLAAALTAGSVIWMAALVAIPWLRATDHAAPAAAWISAAASLICHQRPDRSFHLAGEPLLVCARCCGLYLSAAAGALLAWTGTATFPARGRMLLIAAAVPTIATVAIEWAAIWDPGNLVRAAAALPAGAAAGWLCVRALRAEAAPATCDII